MHVHLTFLHVHIYLHVFFHSVSRKVLMHVQVICPASLLEPPNLPVQELSHLSGFLLAYEFQYFCLACRPKGPMSTEYIIWLWRGLSKVWLAKTHYPSLFSPRKCATSPKQTSLVRATFTSFMLLFL
jgi:hypothetical protein